MWTSLTDVLIQVCKLGGVIWAAVFGVMALLTTFRDEKTQQVTRWGHVALSGIIVSTVLAVGAQLLEYIREQHTQRTAIQQLAERAKQQQAILENLENVIGEIDRQNHALTDVVITMALQFAEDHPMLEDYYGELRPLFDTIIQRYREGFHWYDPERRSVYVDGATGPDGRVDRIWLPVPHDILTKDAISASLTVSVYSSSVSVGDLSLNRSRSNSGRSPDVSFALYSGRLDAGRLHYFPGRRSFVFEFREAPGALSTTRSSMSIKDLQGKLLAVSILGRDNATISLVGLQFKLPSGVAVTIGGDAFKATAKSWPDVSFYTIVDDLEWMGPWPVEHVLP